MSTCMQAISGYKVRDVVPFNPVDKVTKATATCPDGRTMVACKGAPQASLLSALRFLQVDPDNAWRMQPHQSWLCTAVKLSRDGHK